MSYLDWYFNPKPRKKKRATKYVISGGKKYKLVGHAKPRRPKAPDLNGSGHLGMYSQPTYGLYKNQSPAAEYYQLGKGLYNTAKNARSSPVVGFISKKINERRQKKDFDSLGFKGTQVNLETNKAGFLKPNKMELKELRSKSRVKDTPW